MGELAYTTTRRGRGEAVRGSDDRYSAANFMRLQGREAFAHTKGRMQKGREECTSERKEEENEGKRG